MGHTRSTELAVHKVRAALQDGDRLPRYQGERNPLAGHCYVATEAVYHLLGGKRAGLTPCRTRVGDDTHWWLVDTDGTVIDPTADQFEAPVPYHVGVRTGFLTKNPSRRCAAVLARVDAQ